MAEYTETNYAPDGLVIDGVPVVARPVTLLSGQNLARGALLGKVTATGKYNLSLAAAGDGSQTPDLILAEDCDASGGDKTALAYSRGDFDERHVTFGTGHTADSVREGLRGKGIVLLPSVAR